MRERSATIPVWQLSGHDRPALERHFLALDAADRRLRFGVPIWDGAVRSYVERIDFVRDVVFGVVQDGLQLVAVAHVARAAAHAELGLSVLPGHRHRGLGSALLERAILRARNWRLSSLFMHCLAENAAMMHLARKRDLDIATGSREVDAWLRLAPADAGSLLAEWLAQALATFDLTLKAQRALMSGTLWRGSR